MNLEILLVIAFFTAMIMLQLHYGYISEQQLQNLIRNYFAEDDFEIEKIRSLTFKEKVRYREAQDLANLNSLGILWIFSKPGQRYYRVVEMADSNGNEKQKFIEAYIVRTKLKKLTVFDSYDL